MMQCFSWLATLANLIPLVINLRALAGLHVSALQNQGSIPVFTVFLNKKNVFMHCLGESKDVKSTMLREQRAHEEESEKVDVRRDEQRSVSRVAIKESLAELVFERIPIFS